MIETTMASRLAAAGLDWIVPEWPAPANVCALSTTRSGGAIGEIDFSPTAAGVNRARALLQPIVPLEPMWLSQTHGRTIASADGEHRRAATADGVVAREERKVCTVLTADCLPVLFADREGSVVAAAHAGWRGLAAGVLEAAVNAMGVAPRSVLAWLGPAIGPGAFEVGEDVYAAFCDDDPAASACFAAHRPGKWHADLYALARRRLARVKVTAVYGGGRCTFTEADTFYSYRRGGAQASRRMATLVWRDGAA